MVIACSCSCIEVSCESKARDFSIRLCQVAFDSCTAAHVNLDCKLEETVSG